MRRSVFSVLTLVIFLGAPAVASPVGQAVKASSTVSASGNSGSRVLGSSSPVYFMDRLKTNGSGIGQFEFVDGTKLAMGPSATVVVDKYIVKGRSVQRLGIGATKGAFRFISGHSGSSAYNIINPYGSIGVRGTAFDFTIRNGKAYILLAPLPNLGSPEARVFGLLLRSRTLDHLRPEFSASLAGDRLDAPPGLCSKIGVICPIPLCGLSSL